MINKEDTMNEYYNNLIGGIIHFIIEGVDMQDYIREYYRKEVFQFADRKVKEGYNPERVYYEKGVTGSNTNTRTYLSSSYLRPVRRPENRFREVVMRNYMGLQKQRLKKDLVYREEVLKGYHREQSLISILD